jgi:BirA family transcriptional regulator, biotin operon repressor / biotin---[acetyl-CoA-carboxylase] ligase
MPLDLARLPHSNVHWHATIPSTMHAAAELAAAGAPNGTVVGADEQTAGLGRHGRRWHSEPDSGLYISIVLRYPFTPDSLPLVTLALGLATAEAIQHTCAIACDLRWPNDVLIGSKKCAGILAQLDAPAVIAGIGINVNHAAFPPDIAPLATSLRIAAGRAQSREDLLCALLPAVDTWCALLATSGRDAILDAFSHASSYVRDRRVQVDQDGASLIGTTEGLTASGFLVLRADDGKRNLIVTGGVRPCS